VLDEAQVLALDEVQVPGAGVQELVVEQVWVPVVALEPELAVAQVLDVPVAVWVWVSAAG
jgi:hypothetical protein